jgi:hypothetical protein
MLLRALISMQEEAVTGDFATRADPNMMPAAAQRR